MTTCLQHVLLDGQIQQSKTQDQSIPVANCNLLVNPLKSFYMIFFYPGVHIHLLLNESSNFFILFSKNLHFPFLFLTLADFKQMGPF